MIYIIKFVVENLQHLSIYIETIIYIFSNLL